ncbi:C69 family dipeptidase [Pararhodobacter sp. SW119]|uniref:C69 family dipeptidase n=1 Tax=Pararhodobacter sp. SW119 TaxID=2780075 RepID=UPI001ADF723D|nr:C69 family dipeptidase [Pararhodobacter sp. SW119]
MSYGIYIGRDHTADGHAWLAGYGDEPSSHWLELVPRQTHAPGSTIKVGVSPKSNLPGVRSEIPQVAETFRHLRVSYSHYLGVPAPITNGGLNEHGVAVRDIWSSSRAELIAMTPPDQSGPNYSDLARIVLERARTAREGVDIIAALIAEHGYSCYGGNSHIIADPDEAWVVIEFAGAQKLWVAERLGPDAIRAARPGWIGEIPSAPSDTFRFPDHFIRFAQDKGWHDPAHPFDVNRVYGDAKGRWEGVQWVETEMQARAARPEKIGLADVVWSIATEKLTGDTAGYGQVVPLTHPRHDALRVMWHAPVGPVTAPLVPVFIGMSDVPPEYGPHRYLTSGESARFLDDRRARRNPDSVSHISQGAEVTRSAFQAGKRLMHLAFQSAGPILAEVWTHCRATEARLAQDLPDLLRSAEVLLDAGEARLAARLLTDHASTRLLAVLSEAETLASAAEARIRMADGLNLARTPRRPQQIW